jgi:hypothetical protein
MTPAGADALKYVADTAFWTMPLDFFVLWLLFGGRRR